MSFKNVRSNYGLIILVSALGIAGCSRSSRWANAAEQCTNIVQSNKDEALKLETSKDQPKIDAFADEMQKEFLAVVAPLPPLQVTVDNLPLQIIDVKPIEKTELNGWSGGLDLYIPVDVLTTQTIDQNGIVNIVNNVQDSNNVTISSNTQYIGEVFGMESNLPNAGERRRITIRVNWDFRDTSKAGIDHIVLTRETK